MTQQQALDVAPVSSTTGVAGSELGGSENAAGRISTPGRPQPVFELVVRGTPAPKGSKSAFRNKHTDRIQLRESSESAPVWRDDVKQAAEAVLRVDAPPLAGPLRVVITFTVKKPVSAPKTKQTWPATRPDVDKLARNTLDALQDAGVYKNDGQVVELLARKVYPGEHAHARVSPGARIRIYAISGTD